MFKSTRGLFGSEGGATRSWLAGATSVALIVGTVALPAMAADPSPDPSVSALASDPAEATPDTTSESSPEATDSASPDATESSKPTAPEATDDTASDGASDATDQSSSPSASDDESESAEPTDDASAPESAPASDADDQPGAISPLSIPDPGPTQSVISVRVGADRVAIREVTPLAGVVLGLFTAETGGTQFGASCTSDPDGDCNFIVPNTNVTQANGGNQGRQFWVRQIAGAGSSPTGFLANPALRTGDAFGNQNASTAYSFQTPGMQAGTRYESTRADGFMVGTGATTAKASSGIWQQSRVNPAAPQQCGLDVALVLDISGSVGAQLPNLKAAADTLVNSLVGTPSRMSLFSFAANSPGNNAQNYPALTPVATQPQADAMKARYADWNSAGGTNWDRGLSVVGSVTNANVPDVVVVVTDGNPTNYATSPVEGNSSNNRLREVENAIYSANLIKSRGARVLAIGVGSGATGVITRLNLAAITGPTLYNGSNGAVADYFQTNDYPSAGNALRQLALGNCVGSISVVKQVVPSTAPEGSITGAQPAGGWEFTGSNPANGISFEAPVSRTTDVDTGAANFPLDFPGGVTSGNVTLTETPQTGYTLQPVGGSNAVCTNLNTNAGVPVTNVADGFTVSASSTDPISCTVYNRAPNPLASVVLDKQWVIDGTTYNDGQQPDAFQATGQIDGDDQPWGAPKTGLEANTPVELSETIEDLPQRCTLTSNRLTQANGATVDLALPATQTLQPGENSYRITNVITCSTVLELVKDVRFGTADPASWNLSATADSGALPGPAGTTGVIAEVTPSVQYVLAESDGPLEYAQFTDPNAVLAPGSTGSWDCQQIDEDGGVITTDPDGLNGAVNVPIGSHMRCTALNQTAQLRLVKEVVNDNGGTAVPSDWMLHATPVGGPNGLATVNRAGASADTAQYVPVRPGVQYDLSETDGPAGYTNTLIECVNGDATTQTGNITLAPGDQATCRFVNDDVPGVPGLEKTADVTVVDSPGTVNYTLTLTNTGGQSLTGPLVDVLPDGVTFDSVTGSTPAPTSVVGQTVTWNSVTVAAGATVTYTYQVDVAAGIAGGATLTNDATWQELRDDVTVTVREPEPGLEKTAAETVVDSPGTVNYTLTLTNTGGSDATGPLVDVLPDGITFDSVTGSTPAPTSVVGQTVTWNSVTVAPGATVTYTYLVNVAAGIAGGATLTNDATWLDLQDDATVTVREPDPGLEKTADVTVVTSPGEVNYTLTLTNTGGSSSTGALVDFLPDGITFNSATNGTPAPDDISADGRTLTWNSVTVAPGATVTYTYRVNVAPDLADQTTLTNDASWQELRDDVTVTVQAPIPGLEKTADVTEVNSPGQVNYTLTLTNTGSIDAVGPLVDVLPDGITFASATNGTPAPDDISADGRTLTWNSVTVAPGATVTYTYRVNVAAGIAGGTALTNDATWLDLRDDVTVTVPPSEPGLEKTADVTEVTSPGQVNYTLTLTNTGGSDATGPLVDELPAGVTFDSVTGSTPAPTSVVGQIVTWNSVTVAPGQTLTFTYLVNVAPNLADQTQLTNDATWQDLQDDVTVTVDQPPVPAVSKIATRGNGSLVDTDRVRPGDVLTYRVTASNTAPAGSALLSGTLVDTPDLAYVSVPTAISDGGVWNGTTITWPVTDLAGGASVTFTYQVTVNADAPEGGSVDDHVVLQTLFGNPEDTTTNPIDGLPVIQASKTASPSIVPAAGGDVTYTVRITNLSPETVWLNSLVDDLFGNLDGEGTCAVTPPVELAPNNTTDDTDVYSCTFVRHLTQADPGVDDAGLHTNTVTGIAEDADGNEASDDDPATVGFTDLVKTVDPSVVEDGENATYTVTLTNTGTTAVVSDLVDDLPEGVTYVADSALPVEPTSVVDNPDPNISQTLTWADVFLAGGESRTFRYTVHLAENLIDRTTLVNDATWAGSDDNATVTVDNPAEPGLEKAADVTEVTSPGQVNYTLTLTNTGGSDASGPLVDELPAGVTFDSVTGSTPAPTSVVGQIVTWDSVTVAPGQTLTFTYLVNVAPNLADQTQLTNDATWQDLQDDVTVTVDQPPVPAVSKIATRGNGSLVDTDRVRPGDVLTYRVTASNTAPAGSALLSGTLVDTPDLAYVSVPTAISDGGVWNGTTITWPVTDLAGGASVTFTYQVTVNADAPEGGSVDDHVVLQTLFGNPEDTTTNPIDGLPTIQVDKTADPATVPAAGGDVTYTIVVTNLSPETVWLNSLVDDKFGDLNGQGTCDVATPVELAATNTTDDLDTYTCTFTVHLAEDSAGVEEGQHVNVVTATAEDADGNPATDDDDAVVGFTKLEKSVDPAEVRDGENATYTVTLTNTGTVAVPSDLVDNLPVGVTYVAGSATPDEPSTVVDNPNTSQTLTWTGVTLAGGASVTYTYVVRLAENLIDRTTLVNDATWAGSDDNATVTVDNPAEPGLEKAADREEALPGGQVNYTLTLTNTGGAPSSGALVDVLPEGITFQAVTGETPQPDSVSDDGRTLTWDSVTVQPLETVTFTYVVDVDPSVPDDTQLTNDATWQELQAHATVTVRVPGLEKEANPPAGTGVEAGDTITYTVTVSNPLRREVTGQTLRDTLPANVTLDESSITPAGTFTASDSEASAGTIEWTFDLPAATLDGETLVRGSATFTYTVTVDAGFGEPTAEPATILVNRAEWVQTRLVDITEHPVKAMDADFSGFCVGTAPFYEFNVFTQHHELFDSQDGSIDWYHANDQGQPIDANGNPTDDPAEFVPAINEETGQPVRATFTLDANGEYHSGNILWPGAVVDANGNAIDWPGWEPVNGGWVQVNDGGVRERAVVVITVNPAVGGIVAYPPAASPCANPPGVVTMDKTADPAEGTTVKVGDTITYSIEVRNTGGSTFTGPLTDDLPTGFTLDESSISDSGTVSGSTITWNLTLAAGETITVTYSGTVNKSAKDELVNTATLTTPEGPITDQTRHPVKGGTPPLAHTGADAVSPILLAALLTILGGTLLITWGRRRRHG